MRGCVIAAIAAVCLLAFSSGIDSLNGGRAQEDKGRLEDVLRRSCVACYAMEGRFPPSIAYLEEHYGVQIDYERYMVYYTVFAENLMPDITVLEKVL